MYFNSITFLIALIISINTVCGNYATCPDDFPISSPCSYDDYPEKCFIDCSGSNTFDIKATFADLNNRLPIDQKLFGGLSLSNKAIEGLPDNAFAGIQFSRIIISGATNLKRIHIGAFNGTASTITDISVDTTPVTGTVTNNSDLFGAINTLKGLKTLHLQKTGVTALPTNCLLGLNNLRGIYFYYNPLRSILASAFNNLPALKTLRFLESPIERVAEHAFTVGHSNLTQHLDLEFYPQLRDTFDNRTFESIGCPTTIDLDLGSMKHLNRNVFEMFLNENNLNVVFNEDIDCADSRNQWIKKKYAREWEDLKCK